MHKASIIRAYVLENVEIKLYSCSHTYLFLCLFKCSAYRRAFGIYVSDLSKVCTVWHFCTLGHSLCSVRYEPNAARQVCTIFNWNPSSEFRKWNVQMDRLTRHPMRFGTSKNSKWKNSTKLFVFLCSTSPIGRLPRRIVIDGCWFCLLLRAPNYHNHQLSL